MHNVEDPFPFVNRVREIAELDKFSEKSGLIVIFGRRRVGKTRLVSHWIQKKQALYTQVIESDPHTQLSQVFNDIREGLNTSLVPKTWSELFEVLELQNKKIIFCIDEFPYLIASDPSVPSVFQKWLDHRKKRNVTLVLTGSSTHMMHDSFLNRSAPLFGRALKVLHIKPMSYLSFCETLGIAAKDEESFIRFSMVGGIPKYWEYSDAGESPIESANNLYFGFAPYMENEPEKLLSDEKLHTLTSLSILEAIGRGSHRPTEIATKLETPQTSLSRPLLKLMDASFITREIPFGENFKNSKKSLYKISDPALRFWYSVYSPHRVLWKAYPIQKKGQILRLHASTVFEDFCRMHHPLSSRYWEKNVEIDLVRPVSGTDTKEVIVSEVKFKTLSQREENQLLHELEGKWKQTELSRKYRCTEFEILTPKVLAKHTEEAI